MVSLERYYLERSKCNLIYSANGFPNHTCERVATQSQYPWRATIRTILAVVIALAARSLVVNAAATMHGLELATGSVVVALIIAAPFTRIRALPVVEVFPQHFVPWLAAGARVEELPATEIAATRSSALNELKRTAPLDLDRSGGAVYCVNGSP